jgi:hypothetical protein
MACIARPVARLTRDQEANSRSKVSYGQRQNYKLELHGMEFKSTSLITEERPPDPMVARPTVVARTNIRSVKIALAIDPARYRPAAPLMAIAILFTDDFNLGYGFRTRNRVRLT